MVHTKKRCRYTVYILFKMLEKIRKYGNIHYIMILIKKTELLIENNFLPLTGFEKKKTPSIMEPCNKSYWNIIKVYTFTYYSVLYVYHIFSYRYKMLPRYQRVDND